MKKLRLVCLLLIPCLLSAQERAGDRESVDLTIYNQNIALIREVRSVDLSKGINQVIVPDIPTTIDGSSLHCSSLTAPDDIKILEQNYQYDLVHQAKLMEKYIGKDIEFIRVDPTTNKENVVRGKLLATGWMSQGYGNYSQSGSMIAEINEKIEIAPAGRIVLPALPEGLVLKPQLAWMLQAAQSGAQKLEISYLAGGLTWECTYVALLDKDDATIDLTAWVTITNMSGSQFKDAGLKLVAGDVNLQPERAVMGRVAKSMDYINEEEEFQQKDFFEYKLYTLQRTTDINDRETKQIELVSAHGVKAKKMFVYDGLNQSWKMWSNNSSYREQSSFGQQSGTKVGVYVIFQNTKENKLGIALPKGKMRLYKRDTDAKEQFLGEDEIDHTPKDKEVRLFVGNSFDLVGKRVQKDFRVIVPHHVIEETIEITLENHKDSPVAVHVYEHPWRWSGWSIVTSSAKWEKVDQTTLRSLVSLEGNQKKVITYTLRYSW
jgi:hypothetical protein